MPPRAGTPGEPFGWRLCDQVRNAGAAGVQVLELARQPAVIQALKHGGVGAAYSTHTYAMMFLAGLLQEYRPLAEDWRRIRRLARSLDHATSPRALRPARPRTPVRLLLCENRWAVQRGRRAQPPAGCAHPDLH